MLGLQEKYKKEVIPAMIKKFGFKNPMAVPRIEKIVVNSGFGKAVITKTSSERDKYIKNVSDVLSLITGQKPSLQNARISIASFKLREGLPIGNRITLRKKKMYDFLEKLIWLVLPRKRDFRGIPLKSVDSHGSLTIGFKEYGPFPEVVLEKDKNIFGLEVTITTTAKNKEQGIELLRLMGVPFENPKSQ